MVKVTFYGSLADAMGRERSIALGAPFLAVSAVIDRLAREDAAFSSALARTRVRFAINDEIAPADAIVRDGDRLALLPPFSGG